MADLTVVLTIQKACTIYSTFLLLLGLIVSCDHVMM